MLLLNFKLHPHATYTLPTAHWQLTPDGCSINLGDGSARLVRGGTDVPDPSIAPKATPLLAACMLMRRSEALLAAIIGPAGAIEPAGAMLVGASMGHGAAMSGSATINSAMHMRADHRQRDLDLLDMDAGQQAQDDIARGLLSLVDLEFAPARPSSELIAEREREVHAFAADLVQLLRFKLAHTPVDAHGRMPSACVPKQAISDVATAGLFMLHELPLNVIANLRAAERHHAKDAAARTRVPRSWPVIVFVSVALMVLVSFVLSRQMLSTLWLRLPGALQCHRRCWLQDASLWLLAAVGTALALVPLLRPHIQRWRTDKVAFHAQLDVSLCSSFMLMQRLRGHRQPIAADIHALEAACTQTLRVWNRRAIEAELRASISRKRLGRGQAQRLIADLCESEFDLSQSDAQAKPADAPRFSLPVELEAVLEVEIESDEDEASEQPQSRRARIEAHVRSTLADAQAHAGYGRAAPALRERRQARLTADREPHVAASRKRTAQAYEAKRAEEADVKRGAVHVESEAESKEASDEETDAASSVHAPAATSAHEVPRFVRRTLGKTLLRELTSRGWTFTRARKHIVFSRTVETAHEQAADDSSASHASHGHAHMAESSSSGPPLRKQVITASSTPSDWRYERNFKAALRKADRRG